MPVLIQGKPLYQSKDGKFWLVLEHHPQTSQTLCVCRRVEFFKTAHVNLTDTAVLEREDLSAVSGEFS